MHSEASPDGMLKFRVEKAVANFFTPSSKKEPPKIIWRIVDGTLLIGRSEGPVDQPKDALKRQKVAAFDFVRSHLSINFLEVTDFCHEDSTLIRTSSGNVFGKGPTDWRWWHPNVPGKLKSLYDDG